MIMMWDRQERCRLEKAPPERCHPEHVMSDGTCQMKMVTVPGLRAQRPDTELAELTQLFLQALLSKRGLVA
eukprot:2880893-Karenia_brevis.AAC.1